MTVPKAVFFDAGNTLLFINPRFVLPIFRDAGAPAAEEEFWKAELEARANLTHLVEDGGTGTEPRIWQEYFLALFRGCGVPEDEIEGVGQRVMEVHRKSHLWTWVNPTTPPALQSLRAQGYRLAVISNADGRVEGLLETGGIRSHFEFVMDSALEGVEKPSAEIFHRAVRRMNLEPEEALYVGDLYSVDVVGARGAGMEAVLLDPLDRLDYPVPRIPDVGRLPDYLERVSSRT